MTLELLYQKLDAEPDIQGILIQHRNIQKSLRVAGYADDTTMYVQHPDEIPLVLDIVKRFGAASGLQFNMNKTVAIGLTSAS